MTTQTDALRMADALENIHDLKTTDQIRLTMKAAAMLREYAEGVDKFHGLLRDIAKLSNEYGELCGHEALNVYEDAVCGLVSSRLTRIVGKYDPTYSLTAALSGREEEK
jgi:hypothetical protein